MLSTLLSLALLIATPLNVDAQLKAAHAGDTVQFVGVFDHVTLRNRAFNAPLTLTSAPGTTLVNLTLDGDVGVNVQGPMIFRAQAGDWKGGLYVMRSSHIKVRGVDVFAANGPGVTFRLGSDLSLDDSRVDGAHDAVLLQQVDGFTVSRVALTGMSGDGVDVFASHRGSVTRSSCAGFRAIDASHRDCVQLANPVAGVAPVSDVEIGWNTGAGLAQGWSGFTHDGTGFDRISIHDNVGVLGFPQGIGLYTCRACSVKNNHISTLPGSPYRSQINIVGGTVAHCSNTVAAYGTKPAWADGRC